MEISTSLHCKDEEIKVKSCVTEKIIELTDEEYKSLCEDLMLNRNFISENQDLMYTDQRGIAHCILALGKSYDDGILINSEGYGYAKYYSVIPNARQLVILDKYPVLNSYIKRMSEVADDILSKAVAESSEGHREYEINIDECNAPGEPIVEPALLLDMLMDSGMIEDNILHSDSIEIILTEEAVNTRYRECYDANWSTELEIICAKHALWIYDVTGGERADFSNCRLENVNLSNCNLCGADLSNALFINCTFKDASMCDVNFSNSKFMNCNFTNMVAEGSYQFCAKYINCDLTNAYFTASNFKNAKIITSEMERTSFMNCCLENIMLEGSTLDRANTTNICYDEMKWNEDGAGQEMAIGGM